MSDGDTLKSHYAEDMEGWDALCSSARVKKLSKWKMLME